MTGLVNLTFNDGNVISKYKISELIKIEFFRQLLEDREIEKDEVIDIEVKIVSYENMIHILNFVKIDCQEIKDYFIMKYPKYILLYYNLVIYFKKRFTKFH